MKKFLFIPILSSLFVVWGCKNLQMNSYFNKQLIAQVATLHEETPDTNPCAGRSINLSFIFDSKTVFVSQIEIDSCDQEYVLEMGRYDWELLKSDEIKIDFKGETFGHGYTDALVLELKDNRIIGTVTHLNGKKTEHLFTEK